MGSAEDELRAVLDPLESGLRATCDRIDRWAKADDDDHRQWLIDDECDSLEDQLGATFVMAQRFLTGVATRTVRLGEGVKKAGSPWSLPAQKPKWFDYGPASTVAGVTFATLLNASANYFKHASEWSLGEPVVDEDSDFSWSTWKKELHLRNVWTVDTITAAGASPGSSANCRKLAGALGVVDYSDLRPILLGLDSWATAVEQVVRRELTGLQLL
jgi:hypothetical protein